jgi:phenylpropionate dioxygenase-like ring-hydroxylating dioxygenase large terminal subunit
MSRLEYPTGLAADHGERFAWDDLVREDRVHQSVYTDPAIFTLEMTRIFGATWVYLAHESQVPRPDDFVTARLGQRPLIVTRDSNGTLRALYNRCTHRGATVCRSEKGSAKAFQCPYHGWTYANTGKLMGVPWPDGYACDFRDGSYNLAQVPRVESYRGFIFGTLNPEAPPLVEHLGGVARALDEWLDRHPGGKVVLCEANRLKFRGNWKLAYDNACDGYHVVFSHRSLLEMENRLADDQKKGMAFYKSSPDLKPMYMRYFGNGHHYKDKRPNVPKHAGALWEMEAPTPGMEAFEAATRARLGAAAPRALDLASSEPVNINVFPNLSILGNHVQVFDPVSVNETDTTWYGTAIVDETGELGGAADAINAIRMRTMEQFPNFGEVDDLTNFEEIQRGLAGAEDEWVYMHRGLGVPDRYRVEGPVITGPATDEAFMRETFRHYKALMRARPVVAIRREV